MWQHTKGDTFLVLMQNRWAGHPGSYELHAIENGHNRVVGLYGTSYPAAMGGCQQWHGYLEHGGTLLAWLQLQVDGGAR